MAWILLSFVLGIGLGILFGNRKALARQMSRISELLVICLLFVLGAGIGSNREIMANLWSLGWEGLLLALGAVLGSLLLAKPVERLIPGGDDER